MSDNLNQLIKTSYEFVDIAKNMIQSCHLKKNKVYSDSRFVVAFFLRRSLEIFESFLILVKENRIIDSAVLLRSLLDMGINLGYIFAKDIKERDKEIRASKYLLEGNWHQLKLTECNIEEVKEFYKDIELRRDELIKQIKIIESHMKKKYGIKKWKRLPSIKQRAKLSNYKILERAYKQSYLDLSSIEHHNVLFGQHYVDSDKCEPIVEINHLKHFPQFEPSVNLYLFRMVFIEILNAFNDAFQLKWEEKLLEMRKVHEGEYALLKE